MVRVLMGIVGGHREPFVTSIIEGRVESGETHGSLLSVGNERIIIPSRREDRIGLHRHARCNSKIVSNRSLPYPRDVRYWSYKRFLVFVPYSKRQRAAAAP